MMTLYAVLLPVIILFCGISVDIGRLELLKSQAQSAADAAAMSAVLEAERGSGNWISVGQGAAAANGFTNGTNNVTVTVAQQTSYGPYSGHYDVLQATVTQTVNTFFLGPLHGGTATVSAQGVAQMTPCVYLLGTGSLQAYTLDIQTGDWDGDTCPVDINDSMAVAGVANMNVEAINVDGAAGSSTTGGETFPSPNFNAPAVTDPLSYVTQPSFNGTCAHTSYSLTSGSAALTPGNYCKGLNITNATVTLAAGLYVITGGATWSNATVSGTGVTLFFTTGGGASTYGQFKITNGSHVTLSAPTSTTNGGTTAILVFADRSWVTTGAQDFQCSSSTFTGDGIWYIKNAGFYLWSCNTFAGTNYLGLVANNALSNGTNFVPSNNFIYVSGGSPFHTQAGLVQ